MRALAFVLPGLLGLSACGAGLGGPCSLDDPCDEGVCNLSGEGAPVCIDGDGDIDGDGLPNKRDFCNKMPGGEFDEDGDGLGDICDPCPIARPPASPDTDKDGVDSPCDPEPSLDGNAIVFFDGFNGGVPATIAKQEGPWEIRGGEALFTPTDPNAVGLFTVKLPNLTRHVAVQASYRADRVDTAASQNLAGVTSIDRRPAGTSIVTCNATRTGSSDALVVTSDTGGSTKAFTNLFDPSSLYRVAELIDNANGSCAMSAGSQQGAVTTTTPGEAPSEAGLTARGVNARFQYLLLVQRAN